MSDQTVIALAAGGTGGHVYPALALGTELQGRGHKVVLVTDQRGDKLLPNNKPGAKLSVTAKGFGGRNPFSILHAFWLLAKGIYRSRKFLKTQKAKAIVGFGGYPSLPALLAARSLGLPIILHEQNAILGRSNRLFAKSAIKIASGFEELGKLPSGLQARNVAIGNPVRSKFFEQAETDFSDACKQKNLLMLGGSLGARILSETLPAAIALLPGSLRKQLHLVAQITNDQLPRAKAAFEQAGVRAELAPFFDDVETRMAWSHLVIARAGASTIAELAAIGRPSILIPLAIAMDDHQLANAQVLVDKGAADCIAEEKLTPERLAALIQTRLMASEDLANRAKLATKAAKLHASRDLADLVLQIVE